MTSSAEIANLLLESESAVALTGAGISRASGVPTFRDADGLWYDDETNLWADRSVFDGDPATWYESFWGFYDMRQGLNPSPGHYALKDMVEASVVGTIVTQNVDSFDLMAGTPPSKLFEVHGHDRNLICTSVWGCDFTVPTTNWLSENDRQSTLPVCPEDGATLKPDIILFGERTLHEHRIEAWDKGSEIIRTADMLMVVGTTLEIPEWHFCVLNLANDQGKPAVIINPNSTEADEHVQFVIHKPAEEVLPEIRDLAVG